MTTVPLRHRLADTELWQFPLPPPAGASGVEQVPVNVWYLPAEGLLVDTGYADATAWLATLPTPPRRVVLTHDHPDHAGGLAAVQARWPEVEVLRGPAVAGRRFAPAWELVATPGHSADHLVLWEYDRGILFSGDLVLGEGTPWVGPPEGDMAAYLASLEQIAALDVVWLAPGHGPLTDATQIRWTLAHRRQRLAQIAALVSRGVTDPERIVEQIYVGEAGLRLKGLHRWVARWTVEGYLAYLRDHGPPGMR